MLYFIKSLKKEFEMKNISLLLLCLFSISAYSQLPETYNVCWETQSENSSQSMPLGGGSIGLNVWVENGDILFYLAQSGAFDENNQLLKLGRCRVKLYPNPFESLATSFKQELRLNESEIIISSGQTSVRLWVEVENPIVHVEVESPKPVDVEIGYENWRMDDRLLPINERSACYSYSNYMPDIYTYKDCVEAGGENILFYHRNRSDKLLYDFILNQQGLEDQKEDLINTQINNTFGGVVQGDNFIYSGVSEGVYCDIPYSRYSLSSKKPDTKHHLSLTLSVAQSESLAQWKSELMNTATKARNYQNSYLKNLDWWKEFWARSYIYINLDKGPEDHGFQIGRNYQLFRYMLACNAYGEYPTKFNGGLFTYDAMYTAVNNNVVAGTPDYRAWGGGSHTAQNQRLVYWPMLKSGDFDMMKPQFDFYKRGLKSAEKRVEKYWGHKGCCFTEHTETFGLPAASTWGFDHEPRLRPDTLEQGVLSNAWVQYHYTNQLEFSFMMLRYANYTGLSIAEYLPFIESAITFFFEHYKYRENLRNGRDYDEHKKLVIYPSTACETFKNVKNPTDVSAALIACINQLLTLPDAELSQNKKVYWQDQLQYIPDLTYGVEQDNRVLLPAESFSTNINRDIPELYPVYPYGLLGLGKPNLDIALNTWKSAFLDNRRGYVSWHQDGIFCARLGLAEEAMEVTFKKLGDSPRRFPAFWGPGHDYVPDHNWGGSGMIGLQEMLFQEDLNSEIMLLPAWPSDYDVKFKLHATSNRVVELEFNNGKTTFSKVYSQ